MTVLRRLVLIAFAAAPWLGAQAQSTPTLTVAGKVAGGAPVQLSYDELLKLPQQNFSTLTPWSKEPRRYAGPLLRDVLTRAKAQGTVLKAVALNDYQVSIPASDAQDWNVIVALQIDGKPIAVRDKGPFFVIYPFDSDARLQTATYYSRSIWQLKSIQVE